MRGVAKMVAEFLAFVVTIVTLVAWFSGKSSLPDLIGSHDPHPQKSATASALTKAGTPPTKAGTPAKSAVNSSKKPNPLTISLVMGSAGRVGQDRYSGEFGWTYEIQLNGKILDAASDCTIHQHLFLASSSEDLGDRNPEACDIHGFTWPRSYVANYLVPGAYTIKVDVTTKQGYKTSITHKMTLVK